MIYNIKNINKSLEFKSLLEIDYEKEIPKNCKEYIKLISLNNKNVIDKNLKNIIWTEYKILEYLKKKLQENFVNINNKEYDRFDDIKTFDHSMIKLENHFNYMNANYIKNIFNHDDEKIYFLSSQFPVEKSFLDFWKIIFLKKISVIIMINEINFEKKGIVKYWLEKGEELNWGEFKIILNKEEYLNYKDSKILIKRTFLITNKTDNTIFKTNQYHIYDWTDFGRPTKKNTILAIEYLLNKIDKKFDKNENIFIHCRAGIGRTGTFMGLYFIKKFIDLNKNEVKNIEFSMFYSILSLREQRYNLVQTEGQYLYLYEFLLDYINK